MTTAAVCCGMHVTCPTLTLCAALIMNAATAFAEEQRPSTPGLPRATRSEAYAQHAMAATSHPLATQIALDIMRRGGTAIDGAIAANAAIGLMEPTGSGIGGDLFAIVWDPKAEGGKGKLFGYNGSGRSPKAMNIAFVKSKGVHEIPPLGPLPVTVPGCVDGWFALHGKFGKMAMQEVLAPAIAYAENGFPMAPVIADAWELSVRRLDKFPHFREQFTIEGRAPKAGEIWKNPNLARTLSTIASSGRDGFYKGRVAETIASFLQSQGGAMTSEDLATHTGEWVEPVSANYRGYDVWEIPPNGQGIAALQILKVLEGFDLKSMGFGSADYIHTFVEAKKLAFEDRARYYADQAFAKVPVRTLISADYAAERRSRIDPARAAQAVEPGSIPTGADTIYMTVADESGMMVSLIQSNYRGMGSGMVPPGLGFMLQDRGEQFALVEGHPNALQGGKRPFHTIIPAFVTKDGKPWMSFGVMGGAMQPQGHAQIIVNLIDFGMTLQQAGDAPRIHHDGSTEPQGLVKPMSTGGVLNLESGFAPEVLADLEKRGHVIKPAPTAVFGGYQAIRRNPTTGVYEGASESRKDGVAAGY